MKKKNRTEGPLLLASLPLDVLLQIFCYCRLYDILNFSAVGVSQFLWRHWSYVSQTCTRLQKAADEHQVWLHQARLLQFPIPPGTTPSKRELKDWVVSRAKADVRWVESLSGGDGVDLVVYRFDFDEDPLVSAHYLPGGDFLVLLHMSGSIQLKRIEESAETGEWKLSDVARYDQWNPGGQPAFPSGAPSEISYGRFALAYTAEEDPDRYVRHRSDTNRPLIAKLGSSSSILTRSYKSSRKDQLCNSTTSMSSTRTWRLLVSGR